MSVGPVGAVAGQLRVAYLRTLAWLCVIVAFVPAGVGVGLGLAGIGEIDAWRDVIFRPARFFLMAFAVHAAAVYLPIHVAHGVTRRQFALGSAALFGPVAVVFGVATLIGYGTALGGAAVAGELAAPWWPSASDALAVFAEAAVLSAAYICTGWLIGATFYRFGVLLGILLLPLTLAAGMASDVVLRTNPAGPSLDDLVDFGAAHAPAALAISLALVAVGTATAYALVRDVPIRKVSG